MIVCPRCSKENQDHYKFCLGCGAELPRDQAAPKEFAPTPPPAAPPVGAAPSVQPIPKDKNLQFAATQQGDAVDMAKAAAMASKAPPPPAPAALAPAPQVSQPPPPAAAPRASGGGDMRSCPSCGGQVPKDFKFCGSCGHRMEGAAAPAPSMPAAPPQPAAVAPAPSNSVGQLVLINPDGSEGESHGLSAPNATVGRNSGGLFAADSYLSPNHATFAFAGGRCTVRDENSLNGVYYKIPRDQPIPLEHGTVFRIGQEIVLFEAVPPPQDVDGVQPMGSPNPGYIGRISLVIGRETYGNAFLVPPEGMHIGRERGDVIFPEDGYVSGLHCRIHNDGERTCLTDVGSSNGTFVRVRGERACASGDLLLMGQQLFRLQFG